MAGARPVVGGFVTCRPQPVPFETGRPVGLSLLSDLHIGAPQTDYDRIDEEVETARQLGDRVLINGDLLDLILCKDVKRFSPDSLHPRLQGRRNIVNAAVDWAVELLAPVAAQLDMIGFGNHEAAVEKWHGFDPISAVIRGLTDRLPAKHRDHVIHYGGYCGFVDYRLRHANAVRHGSRFVIYYHHGAGHSAPVTKGLIDFNRRDTFVDADLIWLGHKHNRLHVAVEKLSCAMAGDDPKVRDVRHIMTGAYFRTYSGQSQDSIRRHGRRSNYAADMGLAPQGRGGARVELNPCPKNRGCRVRVIQ